MKTTSGPLTKVAFGEEEKELMTADFFPITSKLEQMCSLRKECGVLDRYGDG